MKVLIALCLLGLASAAVVPFPYGTYGTFGAYRTYANLPYTVGALPYHHSVLPTTYAVASAPVLHPGYVAKTPGSTHIAPLPAGLGYASHHINL